MLMKFLKSIKMHFMKKKIKTWKRLYVYSLHCMQRLSFSRYCQSLQNSSLHCFFHLHTCNTFL